tara:strand:- start:192 stop:368 length:177 start_codon:yes stop_codon:yes gene_type:complete
MTPEFYELKSATRLALLKAVKNKNIENIDEFIDYLLSLNLQHLKETLAEIKEDKKNDK